ncbi:Phosphate transport system permease protein pstC [uncultured Ruminococcus sp.]|uniref:phosphate ABC transporter permease subunit PstC n=1 Tax=Massiliimalia timonensis TaxID=1987501 RepID=UPI0008215E6B|nr:phosphate ABC transporter permease subunit PstC [Massiliimalia timonensis]SCG98155.1 Phosphate transport system permease protein pstC [uncultured Ruminococcus sp.]SCH69639.1 Phosphate transport system permease protein pstC [uncultured Clostridium sp.]
MSLHRNADQPVSIIGSHKTKSAIEITANIIFIVCAFVAIVAVLAITIYMIYSGAPALFKVGILDILFGTTWAPTAEDPSFGILYIILTSIIGTTLAILIGVPIALMTAIFLSEVANSKLANIVRPAVELLAGIPSVIYGLLGVLMINPAIYKLEQAIFKDDPNHQFTGGANLLSAVLVLAIMILPTVINISETSLRAVPQQYRSSSLALGASKIQTIFKVTVPAARSGIITGIVLGIGRALGEAMAIVFVCGNSVNLPYPFNSVRTLTTAIVSEMGYAGGLHREVLFTIGLVLFAFIMIINIVLSTILKKGGAKHDK